MTTKATAARRVVPHGPRDGYTVRDTEAALAAGARFWDRRAQAYDDAVQRHDALYERRIQRVASLLRETDTILDVGCASGEIALDLSPRLGHVCGVDTSGDMIALATRKAGTKRVGNVTFHHGDVFDARLTPGSFAAVAAFSVLHLLPDVPSALDRLHALLAPGGLLISETPCLSDRNVVVRSLVRFAVAAGMAPMIHDMNGADLTLLISSRRFRILEAATWDKRHAVHWVVARKV